MEWDRIAYALVAANLRTPLPGGGWSNVRFDSNNVVHMTDLFSKLFMCLEDELLRRDGTQLPRSFSTMIQIFEQWSSRLHANTGDYGPGWAFALFKNVGLPRRATLRELHTAFAEAGSRLNDSVRLGNLNQSSSGGKKASSNTKTSNSQSAGRQSGTGQMAQRPVYAPRPFPPRAPFNAGGRPCYTCGPQCHWICVRGRRRLGLNRGVVTEHAGTSVFVLK